MAGITRTTDLVTTLEHAIARYDAEIAAIDDVDWTAHYMGLYGTYLDIYNAAGNDTEYTSPHESPDDPDPCPACGGIGWIVDEDGFTTDCDHGQPWDDGSPIIDPPEPEESFGYWPADDPDATSPRFTDDEPPY